MGFGFSYLMEWSGAAGVQDWVKMVCPRELTKGTTRLSVSGSSTVGLSARSRRICTSLISFTLHPNLGNHNRGSLGWTLETWVSFSISPSSSSCCSCCCSSTASVLSLAPGDHIHGSCRRPYAVWGGAVDDAEEVKIINRLLSALRGKNELSLKGEEK